MIMDHDTLPSLALGSLGAGPSNSTEPPPAVWTHDQFQEEFNQILTTEKKSKGKSSTLMNRYKRDRIVHVLQNELTGAGHLLCDDTCSSSFRQWVKRSKYKIVNVTGDEVLFKMMPVKESDPAQVSK